MAAHSATRQDASSIRERIYALPGIGYGVLLYTGTADSEGTLGGLIQVGRRIHEHIRSALELGGALRFSSRGSSLASGKLFGPSESAASGLSCTSMKIPSTPAATAALVVLVGLSLVLRSLALG